MIKQLSFLFLFLLCHINSFSQSKGWFGVLRDSITLNPVESVNVLNLSTKTITTSNARGTFFIRVSKGDLIQFHLEGYADKTIEITIFDDMDILISPISIALEEVIITAPAMESEEDLLLSLKKSKSPEILRKDLIDESFAYGLGVSIFTDPLYELISKEGKNHRRLLGMELLEKYHRLKEIRVMKALSDLNIRISDDEASFLITNCECNNNFLITSNDYDFTLFLKNCWESLRD